MRPRLLFLPRRRTPVAARAGATSMIDTSDGLLADLGHVARASRVHIDLSSRLVPVADKLRDVASALGGDPLTWALTGGEDHALAATFPSEDAVPSDWVVCGGDGCEMDDGPRCVADQTRLISTRRAQHEQRLIGQLIR